MSELNGGKEIHEIKRYVLCMPCPCPPLAFSVHLLRKADYAVMFYEALISHCRVKMIRNCVQSKSAPNMMCIFWITPRGTARRHPATHFAKTIGTPRSHSALHSAKPIWQTTPRTRPREARSDNTENGTGRKMSVSANAHPDSS